MVDTSAHRLRLEDAARTLASEGFGEYVVWSDGGRHALAAGVRARLVLEGRTLRLADAKGRVLREKTTDDPFADARLMLSEAAPAPFRAWGFLGFGLAAFRYPYAKAHGVEMHLVIPERVYELDGIAAPPAGAPPGPSAAVEDGRQVYEAAVRDVLAAIRANEVVKVILARQVVVPGRLDALATLAASASTQAARRFAFALDGITGVGACPEILLVANANGEVVTNPLAGTQPRGRTDDEDAKLRANLLRDAKEVSEHATSIRLAYEEIASVCTAETARVIDFMQVKRYAFTQHLSSRAAGTLAEGRTTWDALRAVFPGVTVTGIAKHEAITLIDRLETTPRRVYGGAVGWVDDTGAMDWGIAIRSSFDYGSGVTLNAGAGIVLDSEAGYEFDESAHKMRTMASRLVLAPEREALPRGSS
jgi:salicylate synthetase